MTLARGFHLERMAGGICRAIKFHEQRVIETLRRHIFDGDRPVKSVPGADKIRFDCFRDIQRGILLNENFTREFLYFELPRCRRRRKHDDYCGQASCVAQKESRSHSTAIACRILLRSARKNSTACHSERSEESLFLSAINQEGFLAALAMTVFGR